LIVGSIPTLSALLEIPTKKHTFEQNSSMKIYYWKDKKNFGDLLTGLLLKKFTSISSEWSKPSDSELVMVGSILEQLPTNYKGIIAGCGKLHERSYLSFPEAKILALRGPLTAKSLNANCVLADPGLIADHLVGYQEKKWDLGIVPHWSDTTLEHNPLFLKYNPKIIRISDDPLKVIREIGSCKKIVSSSLHGIILADAFDIPRRVEIAPRMLTHMSTEGGIFKWQDYSASLNMKLEIGKTQTIDQNLVTEKQHELFDVFQEIKKRSS
jgi:pyruvyltransferase